MERIRIEPIMFTYFESSYTCPNPCGTNYVVTHPGPNYAAACPNCGRLNLWKLQVIWNETHENRFWESKKCIFISKCFIISSFSESKMVDQAKTIVSTCKNVQCLCQSNLNSTNRCLTNIFVLFSFIILIISYICIQFVLSE